MRDLRRNQPAAQCQREAELTAPVVPSSLPRLTRREGIGGKEHGQRSTSKLCWQRGRSTNAPHHGATPGLLEEDNCRTPAGIFNPRDRAQRKTHLFLTTWLLPVQRVPHREGSQLKNKNRLGMSARVRCGRELRDMHGKGLGGPFLARQSVLSTQVLSSAPGTCLLRVNSTKTMSKPC